MTPQPATGETTDPVLEDLRSELERIISERVDSELTLEKTWQYLRLRKADLYYRGLQFIAPSLVSGVPDWAPVTGSGVDASESRGMLDYNIDIVRSYGRKYFGVLGLRPFYNVHAEPSDPSSEADRKAAAQANLAADWLRGVWKIRVRNIELFYNQWKSGTVYVYHPAVADKELFGEVEVPQMVQQQVEVEPAGYKCPNCGLKSPQPNAVPALNQEGQEVTETRCPQCGNQLADYNFEEAQTVPIPQQVGTERYPGFGPALHLCTGYTVTVPFDCRDIGKATKLVYEYEEDQAELVRMFGEVLRKKLADGQGATSGTSNLGANQGPFSRAQAASLTATPRQGLANRWTYSRYWLAASQYEYVTEDAKRQQLQQQFPDGLKIHKVADTIVKIENENLSDVWDAITPEPADTLYHDPGCWGILGHQDLKNDVANIAVALLERGLPAFLVDPDVINAEALTSKSYSPVEIYEAKPGVGARLDSAVKLLPPATFPEHAMPFSDSIEANVQQYTGLLPPVWGGGERQPTAEGQRTVLNQALMQLGVPGEYAQAGWASVFTKCCKLLEKHGTEAKAPNGDAIDTEALRAGKYHFEAEPGIPMSWAEKKDQLNSIITQNPELTMALGLTMPGNAASVRDYLLTNMADLHVPDEDVQNYVLEAIQMLLQQQAMDDPTGMGGPPQASMPPDEFIDPSIYQKIAQIVQAWLISAPGQKAKQTNAGGYQNVLAWGMANNMAGMPPPPPPGMGGPPSGPGGEPPAPSQGGGNGPQEPNPQQIQPTGPAPVGPQPPAPQMVNPS